MSSDFVETVMIPLEISKKELLRQKLAELNYKADQFFKNYEVPIKRRSIKISADLRYQHQNYELNVQIEEKNPIKVILKNLKQRFNRIHELNYGYSLKDELIHIVNLRLLASEVLTKPKFDRTKHAKKSSKALKHGLRLIKTPDGPKEYTLYQREKLHANNIIYGPAIIQEKQTSTLLKKGWKLRVDSYGNLIISLNK
jgi:N-methylhydantoinase A